MGEQRHMRTRSSNSMQTKRCSASSRIDEYILVDDDEVIILDYPESSKGKATGTSRIGNKSILQKVISIDDDDDDTENVHKAGTSSTHNSLAANMRTSAEMDNDDCQFVQEKSAAFRFTKCKQSSSTVPNPGIRFGLGSDSENDFSEESECSDCEIFEGSHREVREQWEKAFSRKMKKAGKAGLSEDAGPSEPHCATNLGPFESRTEKHDQSAFFPARKPERGKKTSSTFFRTDDRNLSSPVFGSQTKENNRAHCANSRDFSRENFARASPLSPKIQVEDGRSDAPSTHFTKSREPKHQNGFKEVEIQPDRVEVQCETSKSLKQNQKEKDVEEDPLKSFLPQTFVKDGDTTSVLGTQSNGARCEYVTSRELIIDPIQSTSGQMQGLHGTAPAINVMFNKEKLKETDEYKKAQEEEWESRQRQLQIQAEEVQRERKRRKLENMRQLEVERRQKEVERRQKERVEEVRETQKKDEESMNLKEQVRSEITKSLKLLELKCNNMASLLRGLGIPVGGGTSPLPNEVHAAYKRAVLKFHPDRASRGDIKQQVEAEEKFKLIARMKDKFLS